MQILAKSTKFLNAKSEITRSKWDLVLLASTRMALTLTAHFTSLSSLPPKSVVKKLQIFVTLPQECYKLCLATSMHPLTLKEKFFKLMYIPLPLIKCCKGNILQSLWTIALDQSMTFLKVNTEQWQIIDRLSMAMGTDYYISMYSKSHL